MAGENPTEAEQTAEEEQSDVAETVKTPLCARDAVLEAIQEGKSIVEACEMVGIGRATFYRWKAADPAFAAAYAEAEDQGVDRAEHILAGAVEMAAADPRYQPSLHFYLWNRRPGRWARDRQNVHLSGELGVDVRTRGMDHAQLSELCQQAIAAASTRRPAGDDRGEGGDARGPGALPPPPPGLPGDVP